MPPNRPSDPDFGLSVRPGATAAIRTATSPRSGGGRRPEVTSPPGRRDQPPIGRPCALIFVAWKQNKAALVCAEPKNSRIKENPGTGVNDVPGLDIGGAERVVFHDLVNPCPTTSLTLSHFKKQGYRGGSVGGSFSCGRSGAIRDFKGMGGQTYVHINS